MAERFSELVTDGPPPTMNLKSNPYIDSAMPSSSVEGLGAKPKPLTRIPQPSSAFVLFRSAFLRSHQVPIPPATLLDHTNALGSQQSPSELGRTSPNPKGRSGTRRPRKHGLPTDAGSQTTRLNRGSWRVRMKGAPTRKVGEDDAPQMKGEDKI
ncbi:hypothetical protein FA13DRAFT_1732643 [Coprinellus micaceus]|uniref:Uncharacterized protein n=1 Tax=Coprinellus micaceus TaxID=71717 RepID=A0A4Y7TDW0_COPMI|nr:hypothetical protein FA13DRAFT_1732643 [Coprinellus micaceus]